jgi:hypothetical protein
MPLRPSLGTTRQTDSLREALWDQLFRWCCNDLLSSPGLPDNNVGPVKFFFEHTSPIQLRRVVNDADRCKSCFCRVSQNTSTLLRRRKSYVCSVICVTLTYTRPFTFINWCSRPTSVRSPSSTMSYAELPVPKGGVSLIGLARWSTAGSRA